MIYVGVQQQGVQCAYNSPEALREKKLKRQLPLEEELTHFVLFVLILHAGVVGKALTNLQVALKHAPGTKNWLL
jgi:hypothetical protein